MAAATISAWAVLPLESPKCNNNRQRLLIPCYRSSSSFATPSFFRSALSLKDCSSFVLACLPTPSSSSSTSPPPRPKTRLYVSGLSFRTTEEGLRNAFQSFGELVEVNLVMDKIANRPRGFAFLRYRTEEESQKAIEGMHGKFLDGRVIFVEVAKSRTELYQGLKRNSTLNPGA